jgi:hypothetical protein
VVDRCASTLTLMALALLASADTSHAYSASSSRAGDLSGYWRLNTAESEDADALLKKRLDEERKRQERWMRRASEQNPGGLPPIGESMETPDAERHAAPTGQPPSSRRNRRSEPLRRMLGQTQTLEITQTGSRLQIVSDAETRRFDAGSRSQVSMPEGELADSEVGWDGEWFVIDRRVRRGPRVQERFRLIKKTGQLEYRIAWSGTHLLSGIKVRRVFDRATKVIVPSDPALGPVR